MNIWYDKYSHCQTPPFADKKASPKISVPMINNHGPSRDPEGFLMFSIFLLNRNCCPLLFL